MNKKVLTELARHNLCTYFILPLIKLNKFKFAHESNFVNSFLSPDGLYIYVQVVEHIFIEHILDLHPQYDGLYTNQDKHNLIRYKIPSRFKQDVVLFMKGKFSALSSNAKKAITKYSGLIYKDLNENGIVVSDIRLLALEQSPIVKEMWEEYLKVTLSKDSELLSIPSSECYIEPKYLKPI